MATTVEKENVDVDVEPKLSNADKSNAEIKKYVYAAVATSLLPTPLLDLAAVTAVQLKLTHAIAKNYDKTFSKEISKAAIVSLIGGLSTQSLAMRGIASVIKFVPVVGHVAGGVALATMSGASTYAVGKVFIKHFEAGGTLLDFNSEKMKEYFRKYYQEGEDAVSSTVEEVKKGKG